MRNLGVLLLVLGTCAVGAHAEPETQPAVKKPAGGAIKGAPPTLKTAQPDKGVKVERDIAYVAGGSKAQRLDMYIPENPGQKPMPVVVWVHGGGWQAGSKVSGPFLPLLLNGYAVASVEYRFSQEAKFPAQIQDCQAAIRWVRANAGKYNLDGEHIGVWGDSAGGHLVALLGTAGGKKTFAAIGENQEQSDKVQAVVDFFGPTNFNTIITQARAGAGGDRPATDGPAKDPISQLLGVSVQDNKEKAGAASPIHYVSKDAPAFLIVHGSEDTVVSMAQSVEMYEALKAAGVDATLQKLPGAGHGGRGFSTPKLQGLILAFFDKNLKGKDVKVEALAESEVTLDAKAERTPVK